MGATGLKRLGSGCYRTKKHGTGSQKGGSGGIGGKSFKCAKSGEKVFLCVSVWVGKKKLRQVCWFVFARDDFVIRLSVMFLSGVNVEEREERRRSVFF